MVLESTSGLGRGTPAYIPPLEAGNAVGRVSVGTYTVPPDRDLVPPPMEEGAYRTVRDRGAYEILRKEDGAGATDLPGLL